MLIDSIPTSPGNAVVFRNDEAGRQITGEGKTIIQDQRDAIVAGIQKTALLNRTATLSDVGNVAAFVASCGCEANAQRQGPLVGKLAPEFRVQGIYSEPYSLESFKGHILVMQFGTSW